jgi:hypothetical protein
MVDTTAEDWSIYWRVPVAYGEVYGDGAYATIKVDSNGLIYIVQKTKHYILSDAVLQNAPTLRQSNTTTWTKRKEIKLTEPVTEDTEFRVKFDLVTVGGGTVAHGQVYKNGVAIGIERTVASGTTTFSEDFDTFVWGDLIQGYMKRSGTNGNVGMSNFKLCGTNDPYEVTLN